MDSELTKYTKLIRSKLFDTYAGMLKEQGGAFKFPFITPGSDQYSDILWDWDSWLSDIALRQILTEVGDPERLESALPYEQGCIQNYLHYGAMEGWLPITISRTDDIPARKPEWRNLFQSNMHKPVLAQHAAFLVREDGGNAEWLRERFFFLQTFVNNYLNHHRHKVTGLLFWQGDGAIGVDNDPCTFGRPPRSSGSIFLNCLMYKELLAIAYLCRQLNLDEVAVRYQTEAETLGAAINKHCWDERDGFYYSVDLNLVPVDEVYFGHAGQPRSWDCLIQRIGVWSGFLPMWAGIASKEQAEQIVRKNFCDTRTYNAPFGIRTLSKMEKMYDLRGSGNPSSWLGPIWGVSNYLVFRGLTAYGYKAEATELAEKTIRLFGRDFERFGALHEYYQPENGEPILNRGFQNWNFLVLNMIAWLEGKKVVEEF